MNLRDMPVRRKLMTIILLVSGAVSVLTCATLTAYDTVTFQRSTRQNLATLGAIVAENSTAALTFANEEDATAVLAALHAQPRIVSAALYDDQGQLFARYPSAWAETSFPEHPGPDEFVLSPNRLRGFQPVLLDGRRIGTLYLESDRSALHQRMQIYAGLLALLLVISFVLAFVLSAFLQRQISQPILDLMGVAQAAARGDYGARAVPLGHDELGDLTAAFNHMLGEMQKLNRELEARVERRTAQLAAVNRELEAFSYSVSHDLRAPLRHIDGFAQLLDKQSGKAIDDTGRRYLQTIMDSAKRLGVLIDELLVFSRMGRTELKHQAVELRPMVEGVIRDLEPDVRGRSVEWVIGDLPAVRADSAMLRQVWVNLLSNALKYTRQQPQVRIEISHRLDPKEGHVFVVRDNGAGFDMKYVDKLFRVFQRLHHATEFEGTGIGLANVQRIVQRHHGRVWAEGMVGQGAVFSFTLPAGDAAENAAPI